MGKPFKSRFTKLIKGLDHAARKAAGKAGHGVEEAGHAVEGGVRDAARGARDVATAVARGVKEEAEK
jgi:hypothetical protein